MGGGIECEAHHFARGLASLALAGSPAAYMAHRRAGALARATLDAIDPVERARAMYPSLSAMGWRAPADLEPYLLRGMPIASWAAEPGSDALVSESARWVALFDYRSNRFSVRRALDGVEVAAGSVPPSATAVAIAPDAPEIAIGMADGRIALFREGLFDLYAASGALEVRGAPDAPESGRVTSDEVRILRFLGPGRLVAVRGSRTVVDCIVLETGGSCGRITGFPGIIVSLAATRSDPAGTVWVESVACGFAWSPGSARLPEVIPLAPSVTDGAFTWSTKVASIYRAARPGRPACRLRSVCSVCRLTDVGADGRALVRCRRETFVWDPDGNRVATIARVGEPLHPLCRGIPFLDGSVAAYYVLLDARGRPYHPAGRDWLPEPATDVELARRGDLFEALAIPYCTRAVVSPSGAAVAFVRDPGGGRCPPGGGWEGSGIAYPGARHPFVPLASAGDAGAACIGAPADQIRFSADSRFLVVPCGSVVRVYAVMY